MLEQESKLAFQQNAAIFRKKFGIAIYSAFCLYLLYYLQYEKPFIDPFFIKVFILLSIIVIFHLAKKMKTEPNFHLRANSFQSSAPNRRSELSNSRLAGLGFFDDTIRKSRELLQTEPHQQMPYLGVNNGGPIQRLSPSFEPVPRLGDLSHIPNNNNSNNNGNNTLIAERDEREQFAQQSGQKQGQASFMLADSHLDQPRNSIARHEKSLFENVSFEWPSNLGISDKKQQPTDRRTLDPRFRETLMKDYRMGEGRREPSLQRDNSLHKKAAVNSVRRDHSNDNNPNIARHGRQSLSKGKYTLSKNSIASKSDLRREGIPQYEALVESEVALKNHLATEGVNIEKFNLWAFHNIQVWFAFNLIPEILQRNSVN